MLSPKEFQELYISMYEGMSDDAKEMRRLAAAERRAGNSDRMDAKTAAKYAGSEAKSAEREDKKSKGKHIHGYAIDESAVGDRAKRVVDAQRGGYHGDDDELTQLQSAAQKSINKATSGSNVTRASASIAAKKAERTARNMHPKPGIGAYRKEELDIDEASFVYGGEKKEPEDKRMTVTAADKKANTPAYQKFKAGDKRYKAAPHLGEAKDDSYLETDMKKRQKNNEKAIADMKKTKAHADMVKAARKHFDEETGGGMKKGGSYDKGYEAIKKEIGKLDRGEEPATTKRYKEMKKEELELELRAHLRERALDASEKKEKESVFKAIKPSNLAKSYPEKSPEQLRSLRYAISTAQAKKNMDTSRSDKRYGVER